MKKRIIGLLLCMALLVSVMSAGAFSLSVSAEDYLDITTTVDDDYNITVSWNAYQGADYYNVIFYNLDPNTGNYRALSEATVDKTQRRMALYMSGFSNFEKIWSDTWFVRVSALNIRGDQLYSNNSFFFRTLMPGLETPVVTLSPFGEVSYQAVPNAIKYAVNVYVKDESTGKETVCAKSITQNLSVDFSDQLRNGVSYYASVQAIGADTSHYCPVGWTDWVVCDKSGYTIGDLDFTVTAPKIGQKPSSTVSFSPYDSHFTCSVTWKYIDKALIYKEMSASETFKSGVAYIPYIKLTPKGDYELIREKTQVAAINGKEAGWNYYTKEFSTILYAEDNYYNIYIGSVRVGDGNKNDVLGDGTVKYYKKGEYPGTASHPTIGQYAGTLVLHNFTMPKDDFKTLNGIDAQIHIDQDLNIVLEGTSNLDSDNPADGIYVDGRQIWFYGNGSLNIDVRQRDMTAINCPGSQISLYENVSVTAKGARGIYDPWDGAGENGVYVCENASLSCYACQTDDGHDYPALTGSFVDISGNGRLTCETQYDGEAIWAWGEDYPNSYYDIKVLKKGEYTYYGDTPYTPANGLNVTGGVHESDCRYISITPKSSTPPSLKKGDFDKDGEITVADALAALRIAAKLAPETSEDIAIGDIDGDGEITVADALSILRVAAKLATSL